MAVVDKPQETVSALYGDAGDVGVREGEDRLLGVSYGWRGAQGHGLGARRAAAGPSVADGRIQRESVM